MTALAQSSLLADEEALLMRFVEELQHGLGDKLDTVWLFGSRARGEKPLPESDVDVLVLVDDASWDGRMRVREVLDRAARELELEAMTWAFSVHVHTPQWLAERREIESFFVAELDRDKILLPG